MIISRNADQTDQCWTKGVTIDDCSPVCGGGGGGQGGGSPREQRAGGIREAGELGTGGGRF